MTVRIERVDVDAWDRALPESGFEVFHQPAALQALDRHAGGDLTLLVGYKGERAVGLFPAFVARRGPGTTVLSPPPGMGVPRLGPLLLPASPKRRKREKLNRTFTAAVREELGVDAGRTLFRTICSPSYPDPRPFTWDGMTVETNFTYRLDTTDGSGDDLLAACSKSLRREINNGRDLDVTVSVETDERSARQVHEQTRERYEAQDREYSLTWEYVRDLTDALAAVDRRRTYVARTADGDFISGITVLYSNDAAYFWQGGTKAVHEGVSVNSRLHWRVVEDLIEDPPRASITTYDLMGANTERLCQYKSKFGADLVPYYVVESNGTGMALAKKAYQLVAR